MQALIKKPPPASDISRSDLAQLVTVPEASVRLHVHPKTVLRRAEQLGLKRQRDPRDLRRSVLTDQQVTALETAYPRAQRQSTELSPKTTSRAGQTSTQDQSNWEDAMGEMTDRLTKLEKVVESEVTSLRRQVVDLNSALASMTLSLATATETVATLAQRLVREERQGQPPATVDKRENVRSDHEERRDDE